MKILKKSIKDKDIVLCKHCGGEIDFNRYNKESYAYKIRTNKGVWLYFCKWSCKLEYTKKRRKCAYCNKQVPFAEYTGDEIRYGTMLFCSNECKKKHTQPIIDKRKATIEAILFNDSKKYAEG